MRILSNTHASRLALIAIAFFGFALIPSSALGVDVTWTNNTGTAGPGNNYDWGNNEPGNWDDGIGVAGGAPTFWYNGVPNGTSQINPGDSTDYYFNPLDAAVFTLNTPNALRDIDQHDDIVIGLLHFAGNVDNKTFFEVVQDDLLILTGGAQVSLGQSTAGIGLLNRSSSIIAFEQLIEIDPISSGPFVVNGGTTQIWRVSGTGSDPVGFIFGRNGNDALGSIWADDDAGVTPFVFTHAGGTASVQAERQEHGDGTPPPVTGTASSVVELTLDTVRSTDFMTFHATIDSTNSQSQDYYNAANGGAGTTNDFISIVKTGSGVTSWSSGTSQIANTGIRDFRVDDGTVNLYWSSDDLGATGAGAGGWTTGTTPGRSLIVGDGDGGVDGDILNILRNQQIRDDHTVLVNSSGFISLGGSSVVIQTATSTSYTLSAGQPTGTTSRATVNVGTVNNITEVVGVVTMDGGRIGGNPGSHLVLEGGTVFASDASANRQTALINTSTVSLNEGGSAGAVTFNVTNDGFVPTDLEVNSAIIGAQTSATAASTVTQTGNGVLMFSGTGRNTYSGVTTVNGTGSVLALNKTASGTNYALTGDLVVNNGATVRWDQSNQVNGPVASDGGADDTDVTLNGGTLLFTNSTSEGGTGATATAMNNARGMGSLTLTGANTVSFIDFSAGGGNQIVHFDASPSGWTSTSLLHVLNWDGIPWTGHLQAAFQLGVEGGNGTNQLIFGNSEDGLGSSNDTFSQRTGSTGSSQVGQIRFINPTVFGVTYSGTFNAIILNTGEVVPYAIPEGGTVGVALAVAAVTGLNIWRRRRRTRPEAN